MRAAMKVDTFAGSIRGNENQNFGVLLERFLNLPATFAWRLTVDRDDVMRVEPRVVIEVSFREVMLGRLRDPVLRGVRT